jgi:hypothetical protein
VENGKEEEKGRTKLRREERRKTSKKNKEKKEDRGRGFCGFAHSFQENSRFSSLKWLTGTVPIAHLIWL